MKLALATVSCLAALLAAAGGGMAKSGNPKAGAQSAPRRDATTLLVKFADPATAPAKIAGLGDRQLGKVGSYVSIVRIKAGASLDARLAAYRARADVIYAEPNYIATATIAAPNDPSFSAQWGLGAINAVAGWSTYPGSYTSTGGVPIAVVDTGVYPPHPDLSAHVQTSLGANCVPAPYTCNGSLSSADDFGHGTHVAGIAAALTNNGAGVAGVAISSPIIPVKALDNQGNGTYASIANGILWAASHGARVINLSLGGAGYDATICNAVSSAISSGAFVVAAAGNDGVSAPEYPAACPGAIGVAATDSTGGSPSWSNYGNPDVFISAPGVDVYSTMWPGASAANLGSACAGQLYCSLQGTSMATPHVAGLAALLFGENPSRTPSDVKRILALTAQKVGGVLYGADPYATCSCTWHEWYGYGLINAQAALVSGPSTKITSFALVMSPAGSSVTLTGTGFSGVSSVTFGNVTASFHVDASTQITATVPPGVAYGRWRVTTGAGTTASDLIGSAPLPNIAGESALYGPTGSTVTINGSGFANVTGVTFGGTNVPSFTVVSPTQITATVPSSVAYGRWRVVTPLGTAASPDVFTRFAGTPSVLTFNPLEGPSGSTVTLTGSNFTDTTAVSLGFVKASFVVNSPTQITATTPAGVAYGRWRVTTSGGTQTSDLLFSEPSPDITSLSALSGAVGSTITVTGTDFRNVNGVTFGNVPASYTVVSPTSVTLVVPGGVPYGRVRITNALGTSTSDVVYTVTS
jgi:subtilisin family serine protease